jgi:hypothetical protein
MKIAKESWIIAVIGVADLVTTIMFIRHHGAQEANPLFRHYWEMGLPAFILAKMVCLLGPLMILEWARKRNPRFVAGALRTAIAGYIGFYLVGYMQLNGPQAAAAEVAPKESPVYAAFQVYQIRAHQDKIFGMINYLRSTSCCDKTFGGMPRSSHFRPFRQPLWKFERPVFSVAAAQSMSPNHSFKRNLVPVDLDD